MPAGGTHQSWASVQGSEQQKVNPVSHFPVPKQESGNKRKTPRSKTQPRCLHPTGARFCQHRAGSSFQKPPGFLSNKICTAELFPLARLPSRHGNVPSPSSTCTEPWAAPEHRERHTRERFRCSQAFPGVSPALKTQLLDLRAGNQTLPPSMESTTPRRVSLRAGVVTR